LVLLVDQATDYLRDPEQGWRGEDPVTAVRTRLADASRTGHAALRRAHLAHLTALTSRVSLRGEASPAEVLALPVDRRIERVAAGERDPSLERLLFAYGRYLLLSSSRPGGLPANLQGLWNHSNHPQWSSDYHSNINVQMAYWPAEVTGLPETHEALIGWLLASRDALRRATRHTFGPVRGWTARTSQSPWGGNAWEWNTVSSAWYAIHVLEHWDFTRDAEFARDRLALRGRGVPVLGGPPHRGGGRHPAGPRRLVPGARPPRARRHARPADRARALRTSRRARRGGGGRRDPPRRAAHDRGAARRGEDRRLGPAAGMAGGPRRPRRPPPPHLPPVLPLPGQPHHPRRARPAAGRAGLPPRALRAAAVGGRLRAAGRRARPRGSRDHGQRRFTTVLDLALAGGALRAARRRGWRARDAPRPAALLHPAEPVGHPSAVPAGRQLRDHRGRRRDAGAEPRTHR